MDQKLFQEVISAIHTVSHNCATRSGPEGSREYAKSYSLNIRDARREVENDRLRRCLRDLAIQAGDDALVSKEEMFKYWDTTRDK